MQMDHVHAPQPRTNSRWIKQGGTFKAEVDAKYEKEMTLRRAMSMLTKQRSNRHNQSMRKEQYGLVIPVEVDI